MTSGHVTMYNSLPILWGLTLVHLCVGRECWHHAGIPEMLRQRETRELDEILHPVEAAAVSLAELTPEETSASVRVDLAHKLIRAHDRFADSCYDHQFVYSLTHKICAAYVRHQDALKAWCQSTKTPHPTAECICVAFGSIVRACRNHVVPWSHDSEICPVVMQKCPQTHPFAGLCAHEMERLQTASRDRLPHKALSHDRHGTTIKHSSWAQKNKADEQLRHTASLQHKLRSAKAREPNWGRDANSAGAGTSSRNKAAGRRLFGVDDKPKTLSADLAVITPHGSPLSARRIRALPDTRLCVPAQHPELFRLSRKVYPKARRLVELKTDNVYSELALLLRPTNKHNDADRGCDAMILWYPQAELLHLDPCHSNEKLDKTAEYCQSQSRRAFAHGMLADPASNRISVTADEHWVDTQTEYQRALQAVCRHLKAFSHHGKNALASTKLEAECK